MVDLHVHTCYSLLDGMIKPEELIDKIKEQGKPAICVTDHGHLYGNDKIYKLCKKNNIKPIAITPIIVDIIITNFLFTIFIIPLLSIIIYINH